MKIRANAACAVMVMAFSSVVYGGKPVALMGFETDVKIIKSDVTDRCRYESEVFTDRWVPPSDYGKYAVLYFGEKLRGAAKGKNWIEGEGRSAAENGIFGFDFDSMYNEWAIRGLAYYMGAKAQFNPDRLDFDSFVDDYCQTGFGTAAKPIREYLDAVERFTTAAATANAADVCKHMGWAERRRHQNRLLEHLDFDVLDACLAKARNAAAGDAVVLKRIARLQFGNDLGRFSARKRIGKPSKPTAEEEAAHKNMIVEFLAQDPAAFRASQLGIK